MADPAKLGWKVPLWASEKWHYHLPQKGLTIEDVEAITGPVLWWNIPLLNQMHRACCRRIMPQGDPDHGWFGNTGSKFGSRHIAVITFKERRYKASKWLCQDIIAQRWPPWSGSKPIWRFARMWWNARTNDPCRMDAGAGTGPGNQWPIKRASVGIGNT